jgi:predicted TIM-barrel fold metal-dependent hydrolase
MFSADYPYASMAQARAFLDQLPVSTADKERIAHGNAERLLRLWESIRATASMRRFTCRTSCRA